MSKAIRIHETGGPDVLRYEDVDPGVPGPGEALVRHGAVGVNFIDTYFRSGLYPLPSLPHGIGMEGAGTVEAVGEGVTVVKPGDRVAYTSGPPGAYAEVRRIAADRLVALPPSIDERTGAAMMLQGLTVEYLIRRTFPVQKGMTVLWHAAAGGVGLIACQWLTHLGVTVIGTVGSAEKAELARAHGCAHTILYREEDFVARVKDITNGKGVPVVYDSVAKDTAEGSLSCLSPRGMLVLFGNASGKANPVDPMRLAQGGSLYLTRPQITDYVATRDELVEASTALFEVVQSGAVKIPARHEWPLAEAAEAHRALEGRRTSGSIILTP